MLAGIRTLLAKSRILRELVWSFRLFKIYGRFRPNQALMFGSENTLCLDSREGRGRALLLNQCAGQWYLKSIWKNAAENIKPDLVLDIGANYGEFLFLPRYEADTRVIGIEPNAALTVYLEASRERHPNREQIELLQLLVGAENDITKTLHIDPRWSGRSSALERISDAQSLEVPVASVDHLLRERGYQSLQTLLFKIDVEGYERQVWEGMQQTLAASHRVVGILEYNAALLRQAGGEPGALLDGIADRYGLYYFDPNTRVVCGYDKNHGLPEGLDETDLLVVSDISLVPELSADAMRER